MMRREKVRLRLSEVGWRGGGLYYGPSRIASSVFSKPSHARSHLDPGRTVDARLEVRRVIDG